MHHITWTARPEGVATVPQDTNWHLAESASYTPHWAALRLGVSVALRMKVIHRVPVAGILLNRFSNSSQFWIFFLLAG